MKVSFFEGKGLKAFASIALVLTLVGCSSQSSSGELVDSGKEIDNVTVALPGSLANLYPGAEAGILNYYVASTVYEGLVAEDSTGEIVPALAESWTTPDADTYVFQLRADAKFQDGSTVTPEDVVYSLQKAQDAVLSPGISWYLSNLASVEKTGDLEVTVKTTSPDQAFIKNLTTAGATFITSKAAWDAADGKVGTSGSLVLGSGPYEVTEFVPDSHVTLTRSEFWWGGTPKAKQITVKFIPDENTRLLAAKSGEIDIALNVPLSQVNQWTKIESERVEAFNDFSYVGFLFDQRVKPFDDPKVREAIALSVDKNAIVDTLLRGYGEAAMSIAVPDSIQAVTGSAESARSKLASVKQYNFDLAAAEAALKASTVPSGFTAELTYPNTGPQLGLAAQAVAENLATIGIKIDVKEVPIETWLATIGDGKHGLAFMWYFSTTGDPFEVSSYLVGAGNPNGYDSAEANAIIAKSREEADAAKRVDLVVELEQLNATELVNFPLWWGQSVTAFSNKVAIKDFSAYTFLGAWGSKLYAVAQ